MEDLNKAIEIVSNFWRDVQKNYYHFYEIFTVPILYREDEPIFQIQTKRELYIFDDAFWDIFYEYPFKICHTTTTEHLKTGKNAGCFELVFKVVHS